MSKKGNSIIKKRSVGAIVPLSIVTIGFYEAYLVHVWACDINRLDKKKKRDTLIPPLLAIFTLGMALPFYKVIFAFDITRSTKKLGVKHRNSGLGDFLLIIVLIGFALRLIAKVVTHISPFARLILVFVSVGAELWASCQIQEELNNVADNYDPDERDLSLMHI